MDSALAGRAYLCWRRVQGSNDTHLDLRPLDGLYPKRVSQWKQPVLLTRVATRFVGGTFRYADQIAPCAVASGDSISAAVRRHRLRSRLRDDENQVAAHHRRLVVGRAAALVRDGVEIGLRAPRRQGSDDRTDRWPGARPQPAGAAGGLAAAAWAFAFAAAACIAVAAAHRSRTRMRLPPRWRRPRAAARLAPRGNADDRLRLGQEAAMRETGDLCKRLEDLFIVGSIT